MNPGVHQLPMPFLDAKPNKAALQGAVDNPDLLPWAIVCRRTFGRGIDHVDARAEIPEVKERHCCAKQWLCGSKGGIHQWLRCDELARIA